MVQAQAQRLVDAMAGVDPGVTDTLTEVLVAGNTSGGTNIELSTTDKVQFRDAAIYINSSADGQLDLVADTEIQIAATTVDLNGNLDVSGTVVAGGVVTANAGVVVDNFTLDGTTLALSSGDLTLDSAGGVILDAATGVISLHEAGNGVFGTLTRASGSLAIKSEVSDADILFKGNDGGSAITALTLDMSNAGRAFFNVGASFSGDVAMGDSNKTKYGAGEDLIVYSDGTNGEIEAPNGDLTLDVAGDILLDADGADVKLLNGGTHWGSLYTNSTPNNLYLQNMVSDGDIYLSGSDGGSSINAIVLDMSDAGTAIFNHDATFADNGKAIFGAGSDLQIYHDGSNSYIDEQGTGSLNIRSSTTMRLQNAAGDNYLYGTNGGEVVLYYNAVGRLSTIATGISVTGNISNASGDMTLDVAGNIILDADGGEVKLDDGGTRFANLYKSSNNFVVSSAISDGDILLKGNDGGSVITALTLDMSAAGRATFNNGIGGTYFEDSVTPIINRSTNTNTAALWGMYAQYRNVSVNGAGAGMSLGMETANGTEAEYAYIGSIIEDNTNSAQYGTFVVAPVYAASRAERLRITSAGSITTTPVAGTAFVINEGGVDSDFRVESDNNSHALYVDGADGNVGINCTATNARLEVVATSGEILRADAASGAYRLVVDQTGVNMNGNVNVGAGLRLTTDGSNNGVITTLGQDKDLYFSGDDGGAGINALVLDMSAAGAATFNSGVTSGAHLINAASTAFGASSVQGFNTDFLVDTGQGFARHNSYHTGGSNHQFLVNEASSTTNAVAFSIAKDKSATFSGDVTLAASKSLTITSGQLELGGNYRVRWGGSNNYSIMSDNNNYVQINADGEDGLRVSNTESTFNEGGIDRDFRVESDTNSTAFTVNGGSGQIGLGRGESGSVNADQVTVFGTYGLMLESNDSSVADDEYIDLTLNSGGGGYQGTLIVANTVLSNAGARTQSMLFVAGRGTDGVANVVSTDTGSASFTVTFPSNGVCRITNTSGNTTALSATFFGGQSF